MQGDKRTPARCCRLSLRSGIEFALSIAPASAYRSRGGVPPTACQRRGLRQEAHLIIIILSPQDVYPSVLRIWWDKGGGCRDSPREQDDDIVFLVLLFFSPASNPFKPSQSLKRLSPGRRNLYREREPRKRFQQIGLTCRVCELEKAERDVADLSSHCQRCNRRVAPARPTRTSVCSPISILDQRSNFTPSVPSFLPF